MCNQLDTPLTKQNGLLDTPEQRIEVISDTSFYRGKRRLKSGRTVKAEDQQIKINIETMCPRKWAMVDLENGEFWGHDGVRCSRLGQSLKIEVALAAINTGFVVKNICDCRVVFGQVPLQEFSMLFHGFSKEVVLATDLAERIGASMVLGEPLNIQILREANLPVTFERQEDARAAERLGLHSLANWLANGERGSSSEAMSKRIFGIPEEAGSEFPQNSGDLRRCVLFADATDAHNKIDLMRDVSQEWDQLVDAWQNIVDTFRAAGQKLSFELLRDRLREVDAF